MFPKLRRLEDDSFGDVFNSATALTVEFIGAVGGATASKVAVSTRFVVRAGL